MKPFNWNRDKNQQLQHQRGITFDPTQGSEQAGIRPVIIFQENTI